MKWELRASRDGILEHMANTFEELGLFVQSMTLKT